MESRVYKYEKIVLFIANILSFISLGINVVIYSKNIDTKYNIYFLTSLLIISFVSIVLPIYTLLRLLTKKEYMWMSGIAALFSTLHNALLINLFIGLKNIHDMNGPVLFAISVAKTIIIIVLLFHVKIQKLCDVDDEYYLILPN